MDHQGSELFQTLAKALLLAAALVVLLWFLHEIQVALLVFLLAVILALALNAPVTWLERKRLPRALATLLVFIALLGMILSLGWFVGPRLAGEVPGFLNQLPNLIGGLADRIGDLFGNNPEIERQLSRIVDRVLSIVRGLWQHATTLAASFVFTLVVMALVLYMVADPRPLLRGYITAMPPHLRGPAARAFARASEMVVGWVTSNVILGAIRAVAVFFFLSFMDIPGALLWSVLAFFTAFIPEIGFYLRAIPPVTVALSIDLVTALWVGLFYLVMDELLGNIVAPRIRAETMHLHPVFLLFMTLAMAFAFGVIGVLIASPVAGFLKAYFDEFYLARQPGDPELDRHVEAMMRREPGGVDA